MKIFANPCDFHSVGYYRILVPYSYLRSLGHEVTIAESCHPRMLHGMDLLVLHWPRLQAQYDMMRAFQAVGGKVIVEFDDDMRDLAWCNPAKKMLSPGDIEMYLKILGAADAATTTGPRLAEAFADIQKNIFVCRNALDPNVWNSSLAEIRETRPTAIRIGWAGTTSQHYDDLDMIRRPMVKFLKARPDAQFLLATENPTLVGIFPRTVADQVVWVGSTFDGEPENKLTGLKTRYKPGELLPTMKMPGLLGMMHLDLAIAPIVRRPYSAAKSWIKVLEYGAAGFPVLASDYGPYAEYDALYSGTIALADGIDDWYDKLCALADDAEKREEMARRNRVCISQDHMIVNRLHEWSAALDFVMR